MAQEATCLSFSLSSCRLFSLSAVLMHFSLATSSVHPLLSWKSLLFFLLSSSVSPNAEFEDGASS